MISVRDLKRETGLKKNVSLELRFKEIEGYKILSPVFIDIEIDKNFIKFNDELNKLNGKDFISVFLKLAKIMKHKNTGLKANEKLIELFNQKIIANGQ